MSLVTIGDKVITKDQFPIIGKVTGIAVSYDGTVMVDIEMDKSSFRRRLDNVQLYREPDPRPRSQTQATIRFTMPNRRMWGYREQSESSPRVRRLLNQVFGLEDWELPRQYDLHIVCTSEQFARFIIQRHNMGLQNGIAELNAHVVDDDFLNRSATTVDVRKR